MENQNNQQNNGNNGEGQQNQNNQQNNQNNNGSNSSNNSNQNNVNQQNNNNNVDTEKVKNDAISELLKTLGVDTVEMLQEKVTKQKEAEDAGKTDLQKANDTLKETTRQLVDESRKRLLADAKLQAMILGAKPDMLDDLVTVAMSKVTKEKDIVAVMTEMKEGKTGQYYFGSSEQTEEEKRRNITSKRTNGNNNNSNAGDNNGENGQHNGTMAERLLAGRKKQTKSHYFSN